MSMTKDSERIYHIERKVDAILEILQKIHGIKLPGRNPLTEELWPMGDPPNDKEPMYVGGRENYPPVPAQYMQ